MKSLRCRVGLHDWRTNGKLTMTCVRCLRSAARGPLPASPPYWWRAEQQRPDGPDAFVALRDGNSDVVDPDLLAAFERRYGKPDPEPPNPQANAD